MRTVSRLSAQRRIFELNKAKQEELQQELEDLAKHQNESSENKKVVYGRQQSKRS